MKKYTLFALILSLIACGSKTPSTVASKEKPVLVTFSSEEGMKRLRESESSVDFYTLANNFENQDNGIVCGAATSAIVLNALNMNELRDKKLLINPDTSSISAQSKKHIPKGYDPALNEYSQYNVFDASYVSKEANKSIKSRDVVMGKPLKGGKQDFGFSARQLSDLLNAHAVKSELRIVADDMDAKVVRAEILKNLSEPNNYVIVNYFRRSLGQIGLGHISPLGAYHRKSDSVLIMDVNPVKGEWIWVKMDDLIASMRTNADTENRGYLLVSK